MDAVLQRTKLGSILNTEVYSVVLYYSLNFYPVPCMDDIF